MTRDGPIFFVGVPRSGTTALFEHFAGHPDLAWLSSYTALSPRLPVADLARRLFDNGWLRLRGRKDQFGDAGLSNTIRPQPAECWAFWRAHSERDFAYGYLRGERATPGEARRLANALDRVRRYQGRPRMSAKLTGPGRITYLDSVWPDARFVHVVRDGLDVVRSLLEVDFWRAGGGLTRPWWHGLDVANVETWEKEGRDPAVLAAVQWKQIVATTREEVSVAVEPRYREVRYEDYRAEPEAVVADLRAWAGLPPSDAGLPPAGIRTHRYLEAWDAAHRADVVRCMQPVYGALGYR